MSTPALTVLHALNGLLMVAMPLALALFLARRFGLSWRLFWIGAATFVLSQALHIPANLGLNWLFTSGGVPAPGGAWRIPFFAALAGLSAGLFEEGARYAVYRWWARDARSWSRALLLGCGHGGAESILLGLLALYSLFSLASLRGADLGSLVPAEQLAAAQAQIDAYWSMPGFQALLGAVERALSIPVQIGLSVLVLQTFTRRQIRWLFLAIAWHAAIDAVIAGYLAQVWQGRAWAPYALEGAVAVATAISLAIIWLLRTPEPRPAPVPTAAPGPLPAFQPREVTETAETLEETRYHD